MMCQERDGDEGRGDGVGERRSEPSIELTARGVERLDAALEWARREVRSLGLDRGRIQIALERLSSSGRYTVRLRFVGPRAYASARSAGKDLARTMKAAFRSVRGRLTERDGGPQA